MNDAKTNVMTNGNGKG